MKYTATHEWIETEGRRARVGISHYAQKELGDIVYVELPKIGQEVKAGDIACVLESTKAAADVYSPVSGTIIAVNNAVKENPEMINKSAEKEGWLFDIDFKDPDELFQLTDEADYNPGSH